VPAGDLLGGGEAGALTGKGEAGLPGAVAEDFHVGPGDLPAPAGAQGFEDGFFGGESAGEMLCGRLVGEAVGLLGGGEAAVEEVAGVVGEHLFDAGNLNQIDAMADDGHGGIVVVLRSQCKELCLASGRGWIKWPEAARRSVPVVGAEARAKSAEPGARRGVFPQVSESRQTSEEPGGPGRGVRLVRLPVEKPQVAAAFLRARSRGVMDLIAHFWERLSATPPLSRGDLHLMAAMPENTNSVNINIQQLDSAALCGAMLYVPRAHRADVLALDEPAAEAFASYIGRTGRAEPAVPEAKIPPAETNPESAAEPARAPAGASAPEAPAFSLTDLSANGRGHVAAPGDTAGLVGMDVAPGNGKAAIDFLTGDAQGLRWMTHYLLPLVHRRTPARELINVVMQLPSEALAAPDANVRLAREADIPVLNRWRRQYKDERGILFDADMDAWVEHQRVFVYEIPAESAPKTATGEAPGTGVAATTIVAVAKIDLDLQDLVEIGGVYTFPEYRQRGYGAGIVRDLAHRIRHMNKTPTLQVDERNTPALRLYAGAGWMEMGRLGRVWLTG